MKLATYIEGPQVVLQLVLAGDLVQLASNQIDGPRQLIRLAHRPLLVRSVEEVSSIGGLEVGRKLDLGAIGWRRVWRLGRLGQAVARLARLVRA